MMDLHASSYVGTPSFLKIILQKAEEMGLTRETIPLKKALFSAEPYPPSLRAFFEEDYEMITSQAYATAELGIIAYDKTGDTALRLADNMIIEITDPETGQPVPAGEVGQVVVTTFNETYLLIRLGLGDLSAFVGEADAEGYHTHIKGWLGRVGDAIKVRGMFLHPLPLKAALAKFTELGNFQASVTRPDARDYVQLQVELLDEGVDKKSLREAVLSAASNASRLKIDAVEFVAPGTIETSARTVLDERNWD
jgi:phenylacetate-CoA ligase